ncbi:MAG: aspartate aminotransferase family protein [Chloroflexi bacterium]|nr:aspartate aminotransferase family protein [Chloroflexota bacterium]
MVQEAQMLDAQELTRNLVLDFIQMSEFARNPVIFEGGEGIRVTSADGKVYVDGLSGAFVVALGHRNRAVIDAMAAQLQAFSFNPPLHGTNTRALELAAVLREVAPPGLTAVKFMSSGSEATEAAMKLARQYHQQTGHPRKFKVISRYGAYHGATAGAAAASGGVERRSIFEPFGAGYLHVHPPCCYQCPFDKTYPVCDLTCAKLVERTVEAEDPETVSAVIMEPLSVSAIFVVPPPEYFAIIREACDRHNVLLIFDEIVTGFGRLGSMFGADYFGVTPDILACGKGISSGYAPLAAMFFSDRIHDAFLSQSDSESDGRRPFQDGHTYGGNPVACAAGIAAVRQILDRGLVENARVMGNHLRKRLEAMAEKYRLIGDVRGVGLLQGMQLLKDRTTREPFGRQEMPGKLLHRLSLERGLILRATQDFVVLAPPLIVNQREIDEICTILDECIGLAQRQLMGA